MGEVDQAKLDEYIKSDSGDYARAKKQQLDLCNDVLDFLGDINQKCHIQFRGHVDGAASAEYELVGAGYGDLCAFVWQIVTMEKRQELSQRMVSDFNDSQE